jgi:hypothetical protein
MEDEIEEILNTDNHKGKMLHMIVTFKNSRTQSKDQT